MITIKKSIVFIFTSTLFLLSCENQVEKSFLQEEEFQQHKILIDGKYISFMLPKCYSDTFLPNSLVVSYWAGYEEKHVFYSTENIENFFSVVVYDNGMKLETEAEMDTLMYIDLFKNLITNIPPVVPFIEKKKDKKGRIYYLTMSSYVDSIYSERNLELNEQHLIHSEFAYGIYLDFKYYMCVLITQDKISEFSYEEKRKIIESVRIEG